MKTDTQLQRDVMAELNWEPSINAASIGVEVRDGIVTLAGHVQSFAEKWAAERSAQRVLGVKAVAVEIEVSLPGSSRRTDADIARSAQNVLEWTANLPANRVKVMVEGGWVTLSGEVDWNYQRKAAAAAVRHLMGVTGVSDRITLEPKISSSAVRSDIEAALKRRANSESQRVAVEVKGADVTLTGSVHSWSERELATQIAWSTGGVRSVVDKLTVIH